MGGVPAGFVVGKEQSPLRGPHRVTVLSCAPALLRAVCLVCSSGKLCSSVWGWLCPGCGSRQGGGKAVEPQKAKMQKSSRISVFVCFRGKKTEDGASRFSFSCCEPSIILEPHVHISLCTLNYYIKICCRCFRRFPAVGTDKKRFRYANVCM